MADKAGVSKVGVLPQEGCAGGHHAYGCNGREAYCVDCGDTDPEGSLCRGCAICREPNPCEGGKCWTNEMGYLEACPKHEAIFMDEMMRFDAARAQVVVPDAR